MDPMKFKRLNIKDERSMVKRWISSPLFKQVLMYCSLGALIGYALFYFGQGGGEPVLWSDKAAENIFIGLGFGVFLSTSPCAGGRCS
ncbi:MULTISPECIES: hypothetical protein [unclassified Carboxylicivirga]|uniref:hypothetical protein n=1 Tax=Carboxylicivirga TaxID=1628153 RepID=UPI003D3505DA